MRMSRILSFFLALAVTGTSLALAGETNGASDDAGTNVARVGDMIEVHAVGYEDELDGIYRVESDGTINVPYVGRISVGGFAGAALEERVRSTVWEYYINRPAIVVTQLQTITVLGHVFRPGSYQVEKGERLTTLLGMAGGTRPEAAMKSVRVTREGETMKKNLKSALQNGRSVNDIGIQSGDVIFVPQSSFWNNLRNWAVVVSSASLAFAIYDRVNN